MSKISLQMYTMREYTKTEKDLAAAVEKLGKIGFKNLQYSVPGNFDAKNVYNIFKQNGIYNDSLYCDLSHIEDSMPRLTELFKLFPSPYLRLGSIPDELIKTEEGVKRYASELNRIGKKITELLGVKLLYHFHAFEFINFPGGTGMDILLNETDKALIDFQPDTFWMQAGGKEPSNFLRQIKDRITYVHVKDYRVGLRTGGLETVNFDTAEVGSGNLHWDSIIKACKEIGIKMYVIEQDNCNGLNPFDCVAVSFNNLIKFGVE